MTRLCCRARSVTAPPIGGLFVYRVLSGRAKKRAKDGLQQRPDRAPAVNRGRQVSRTPVLEEA